MMPNWITGNELMVYWNIEDFELFNCLKKGLQPYRHGHKIIDTDTLEHARARSLESYITPIRRRQAVYQVGLFEVREALKKRFPPMSEQQILQEATKQWKSQPLWPVNRTPYSMSFALPDNEKSAHTAIKFLLTLKFRKDEASQYAKKHGHPTFDGDIGFPIPQDRDQENSFILKVEYWSIRYEGSEEITIQDSAPIRHIVHLIEKPHQRFPTSELKRLVNKTLHETDIESKNVKEEKEEACLAQGLTLGDLSVENLSNTDKEGLENLIYNAWNNLNTAKDSKNEERIASAQQEFDKAKTYLYSEYGIKVIYSSKGLSFKVYSKSSKKAESARSGTAKHIKIAKEKIKVGLPRLSEHLDTYINTGGTVDYTPPTDFPKWFVRWNN